jgi:simple sugar transport system ATP-binding protein
LEKLGFMKRTYLDAWTEGIMRRAQISQSPVYRVDSFSGGMQQRILLAREFAERAPLLVLSEPGWGLDRLSRENLAGQLRAYAGQGNAVLLFSTDIDELVSLAQEILVLRNGEFSARVFPGALPDVNTVKKEIAAAMV